MRLQRHGNTGPVLIALAALVTASCKVGPDFELPPAPAGAGYTASPLPDETGPASKTGTPSTCSRPAQLLRVK